MRGAWVALLAGALACAVPAVAADHSRCAVPDTLMQSAGRLPVLGAALHDSRPVRIVVLGTGSSAVSNGAGQAKAYPAVFGTEIGQRIPKASFTVHVQIRKGLSTAQMLPAIDAIVDEKPTLVIWQTGSVDAVRQIEPASFADALIDGIQRLHGAGIDVVVVGPQYSRNATALIDFRSYLNAMEHVAQAYDVPYLDRYSIMQYWSDHHVVDLEGGRSTWAATTAFVHDCVGNLLADLVAQNVEMPKARE